LKKTQNSPKIQNTKLNHTPSNQNCLPDYRM